MRLSGKTAIITGAATGIGAVYAQALVNEGAYVVVADVLESAGQVIVRALNAQGDKKALFVKTNVTSEADTERMAQVAVETFERYPGEQCCHVLRPEQQKTIS